MPIHRHLKSFGTFRNQQVARSSRVTSSRNSPYQSIKPHQPLSGYLLRKACLFPVPRTPSSEKILVRTAVFPLPFPGGFYILSLTMACWFHRLRQPETDCERGTESGHRLVNRSIRSGSGAIRSSPECPQRAAAARARKVRKLSSESRWNSICCSSTLSTATPFLPP